MLVPQCTEKTDRGSACPPHCCLSRTLLHQVNDKFCGRNGKFNMRKEAVEYRLQKVGPGLPWSPVEGHITQCFREEERQGVWDAQLMSQQKGTGHCRASAHTVFTLDLHSEQHTVMNIGCHFSEYHRNIKHPKSEGTHKDHQIQLMSPHSTTQI